MRIGNPGIWVVAFSITSVLLVGIVDLRRTSPGELAVVHSRIPELAGYAGCSACHGGWTAGLTESCLKCHGPIAHQIEKSVGIHGILDAEKAMQCAKCHSDHHGAGFAIVNLQSFIQAGIRDPEEFDHDLIGYSVEGRHLDVDCVDCHANAQTLVLPEGETRFIGLDPSCVTCHQDPHEGRMDPDCTACHTQTSFEEIAFSEHAKHLPLVGGHANLGCRECHSGSSPHALEAMSDRAPVLPQRECRDCHDSPHRSEFVAGIASMVAMSAGMSCVTCHESEHLGFQDERITVTPAQHEVSGFALSSPHDVSSCVACHRPEGASFGTRFPGRHADKCSGCHRDPHDGQFERGEYATKECIACHDRERFVPHALTPRTHAATALPLTGRHLEIECRDCHLLPVEGGARVFHGTPSKCEDCHQDAHRGYFEAFDSSLGSVEEGSCARCHVTTTFHEVSAEGFDHTGWTGFPLNGAHLGTSCESCHPRSEEPDEFGRSFGRVVEHFGPLRGCVTCHTDPHRGRFDVPDQDADVDGGSGCIRCHDESSFRQTRVEFDHSGWTGFALDGAHIRIDCSACHAPMSSRTSNGRSRAPALGQNCSDCHVDPHAGQFERNGVVDCQRCHRSESSFSDISFNHNLHSRFPLTEGHAAAACSACHRKVRVGSSEMVRYRPLGRNCVDCHRKETNPLRNRKGRR